MNFYENVDDIAPPFTINTQPPYKIHYLFLIPTFLQQQWLALVECLLFIKQQFAWGLVGKHFLHILYIQHNGTGLNHLIFKFSRDTLLIHTCTKDYPVQTFQNIYLLSGSEDSNWL